MSRRTSMILDAIAVLGGMLAASSTPFQLGPFTINLSAGVITMFAFNALALCTDEIIRVIKEKNGT